MTRTGAAKSVEASIAPGRLAKARAYHAVASMAAVLLEGRDRDPVVGNAILAAIAYCDAITAAKVQRVSQQDHAAAVKLLRDALGNELPKSQETNLATLLGRKNEVQYGARPLASEAAEQALRRLDEFGAWAVETLRMMGVEMKD